ncbi:MAG: UDP pyrophosphate phosphatase [Bacillaceae bacterium]|nr:UDP pyrophosphate phosphatase [Bacillaceae bacterium]
MDWLEAIILGIIQGIGEPIPVSSSAQTKIASFFMEVETPGIIFEVFLNFASFLAILWLTRKDVMNIVKGFFKYLFKRDRRERQSFRMGWFVILGTVPAVFTGFTMKDIIDQYLSSMTAIGIALIVTGLFLFFVRRLKGRKDAEQMTWKDALLVGVVQGTLALIPGISRSGSTVVTALYAGLNRETAFRYSFLLYLPIGFGTMVLGAEELLTHPLFLENIGAYLVMFIASFFMTMVGYYLFKGILERGKLIYFSLYCWALGLALIILYS